MLFPGACRPWYERNDLTPEEERNCRSAMHRYAQLPICTYPVKQEEPPQHRLAEESVVKKEKPTLLDIARRAVLEAGEEWAREPIELVAIITNWWVPGAQALGLTVSIFYSREEPLQLPEMRIWLLNEERTFSWPRPDGRGFSPLEERGRDRRPRELGEVMTTPDGRKYMLIGFIQSEHWSSGVVDSAAFVPAEEVQL